MIGLALRFLSGFSAARRYLADASYWLYLIHLPIVMALQVAVSNLDWPWPVKFGGILLVALPLMFASYQLLVRYSFIGAVLNGRRMRREGRLAAAAAASAPQSTRRGKAVVRNETWRQSQQHRLHRSAPHAAAAKTAPSFLRSRRDRHARPC